MLLLLLLPRGGRAALGTKCPVLVLYRARLSLKFLILSFKYWKSWIWKKRIWNILLRVLRVKGSPEFIRMSFTCS